MSITAIPVITFTLWLRRKELEKGKIQPMFQIVLKSRRPTDFIQMDTTLKLFRNFLVVLLNTTHPMCVSCQASAVPTFYPTDALGVLENHQHPGGSRSPYLGTAYICFLAHVCPHSILFTSNYARYPISRSISCFSRDWYSHQYSDSNSYAQLRTCRSTRTCRYCYNWGRNGRFI